MIAPAEMRSDNEMAFRRVCEAALKNESLPRHVTRRDFSLYLRQNVFFVRYEKKPKKNFKLLI
jgi:hypothetical protein